MLTATAFLAIPRDEDSLVFGVRLATFGTSASVVAVSADAPMNNAFGNERITASHRPRNPRTNSQLDPFRGNLRILLPAHTNDEPFRVDQAAASLGGLTTIFSDLVRHTYAVRTQRRLVRRGFMRNAAIYDHGNPCRTKFEIGSSTGPRHFGALKPVAQSAPVEGTPKCKFWTIVRGLLLAQAPIKAVAGWLQLGHCKIQSPSTVADTIPGPAHGRPIGTFRQTRAPRVASPSAPRLART